MSEVTMVKNGDTLSVNADCVDAHKRAGWSIATEGQEHIAAALSALPEVQAIIAQMQERMQGLEAQVVEQSSKIQELESDVELASNDEAPDDTALIELKAKVAALELKKADGTATQADKMLLGRLSKKIPA